MAMNKKEQAEMKALRDELAIVSALRWTEPVKKDLLPPDGHAKYTSGFEINPYNLDVSPAWSGSVHHKIGHAEPNGSSAYQNSRPLFSNKMRALKALRHAVELESAKKLAKIDAMIKEEHTAQEKTNAQT